MPLTQEQEDAAKALLQRVDTEVSKLCLAQEDVRSLFRIHPKISSNDDVMAVLDDAKKRGKEAAKAIEAML